MTSYGEIRLTALPHENLVDDLTTVSGLILAYGMILVIGGTVDLASAAGDGNRSNDWDGGEGVFPPVMGLLAQLTIAIFGLASVFLGFQYVACRWGSKTSSFIGLVVSLSAWFPFLVTISFISFEAHHENVRGGTGPLQISHPTVTVGKGEINSIALMGILGFWGYACTVIGALTFLQWKMYRCFRGGASTYSASYYRSRLGMYGFLSMMIGALQISLGTYIESLFGWGQLPAPVVTGPFFILWPEISIAVGICQLLFGLFIIYRSTTPGVGPSNGNKDPGLFMFQMAAWSVFLVSMCAQVLGQVSLHVSNAPAIFIRNVVGFALFPIYLDVMAHTTPENVTTDMLSFAKITRSGDYCSNTNNLTPRTSGGVLTVL